MHETNPIETPNPNGNIIDSLHNIPIEDNLEEEHKLATDELTLPIAKDIFKKYLEVGNEYNEELLFDLPTLYLAKIKTIIKYNKLNKIEKY